MNCTALTLFATLLGNRVGRNKGLKSEVASHRTAFPDWSEKGDDIIAEGGRVVIRFTSSGTQRGEFAGVAPHGEKVTIHEAAIYRVVARKIVEQWVFRIARASCSS